MAIECNYSDEILSMATRLPDKVRRRIRNSHMEIERTCTFLQQADRAYMRTIYLLHLSDGCSNAGLFQDLVERVCPGVEVVVCPKER